MKAKLLKNKRLYSVLISFVVVTSLLITLLPLQVKADSSVNVYDDTSLEKYIAEENTDIVLWQDITYSGSQEVNCKSIDLNGYSLTWSKTMILGDVESEFTILDSTYDESNETNSGNLVANYGIDISNRTLIIENACLKTINSGINGNADLKIYGGNILVNGYNGAQGSTAYRGENGGNGESGKPAIQVNVIYVYGGTTIAYGGNGGNGGDGAMGLSNGADGGNGGNAGCGASGINANNVMLYNGKVIVYGGNGGNGGCGANGRSGSQNYNSGLYDIEDGGDGGNGGNNSYGADGITSNYCTIYNGEIETYGGNPGKIGGKGLGGMAGTYSYNHKCYSKKSGAEGNYGNYCGSYGGAGINAELSIYDGKLKAVGGENSAGIGGSGIADFTSCKNINISGGKIIAKAGEGAFDIGSGYCTSYGTTGTFSVTGGTVEFCTNGKPTNISETSFTNCTITGDGAGQLEGTYNNEGKFTIDVSDITVSTKTDSSCENKVISATLNISRISNITKPKSTGYVSFELDGKEIGTSSIVDATPTDTNITAKSELDWTAVEGEHTFTAKYVEGTSDKYSSGEEKTVSVDVSLHTYGEWTDYDEAYHAKSCACGDKQYEEHDWNDGVITLQPTCKDNGEIVFTCTVCGATKTEEISNSNTPHTFRDTVTDPTETTQGYTTHKCTVCGYSYVDSYTYLDENPAKIVVESKKVVKGRTFTISVWVENNPGFSGLEVTPYYSDELTLVSVENGELISDLTQGKQYVWIADEDVTTDGKLLTFTFSTTDDVTPNDYEVGFTVRSCVNYNETSVNMFSEKGTVQVIGYIYGDANGDDVINLQDIVRLKKYLANYDYDTQQSSVEISEGADANGDDVISIQDIVRLKKYFANYDYDTNTSTIVLGPQE